MSQEKGAQVAPPYNMLRLRQIGRSYVLMISLFFVYIPFLSCDFYVAFVHIILDRLILCLSQFFGFFFGFALGFQCFDRVYNAIPFGFLIVLPSSFIKTSKTVLRRIFHHQVALTPR